MLVETRAWYTRGAGYNAMEDKDISIPKHEIPDEMAIKFMTILEQRFGLKRHENSTQIWYDVKGIDNHHWAEEIFYK